MTFVRDAAQFGLHVQVGADVGAVRRDVRAFKEGVHLYQVREAYSCGVMTAQQHQVQHQFVAYQAHV